MAVTKTAKRAVRQAENRAKVNEPIRKQMKAEVKDIKALIVKGEKSNAEKKMAKAFQAIDKAAKGNLIKKGNANRKKSRLAKAVAKLEK